MYGIAGQYCYGVKHTALPSNPKGQTLIRIYIIMLDSLAKNHAVILAHSPK